METHGQQPVVTLSWTHLRVKVKQGSPSWLPGCSRPSEKIIVDDVSGAVDGGSFLAVVGGSGTGKTTLLAAITKRLHGSAVSGDILLNGRAASPKLLSRVCGFVPQHDLATETLTAMEHLTFMALMRLDAHVSDSARARRVRVLLGDLGLAACALTRLANLSGGERKRLSIAVQLLASPLVLALDEPCSGLDAEGSRLVLETLRREADRGRAVLCTVHQAAPDMLQLFTDILVLASGRVVFHGPLHDVQPFLAEAGAGGLVSWGPTTPLHAMLQQLCNPEAQLDSARVSGAFALTEHHKHLHEYPVSEEVLSRDAIRPPDIKHTPWITEVRWLVWREAVVSSREGSRFCAQIAVFLITAIIMSLSFSNTSVASLASMAGVQSTRGLLYLIVSEVVFTHAYAVFYTFPGGMHVFLREAHLYSSSAYYVAKVLGTVPRAFVEPLLFVSLIQARVDLTAGAGPAAFFGILGILFLAALTASAYGCMISAQFKSSNTVLVVTQPVEFVTVLVAGIFNTIRSLPVYVTWARFVSVFYYCHELLSIAYWRNIGSIACTPSPDNPCFSDGQEVLEDMGFDSEHFVRNLVCMSSLFVCLHAVGFLGVLRRSRQQAAY